MQEKRNPVATVYMADGSRIVIELLPEYAPNTVNSFINLAQKGVYDNYAIQRVIARDWIDVSYSAFGKEEARYLIPSESELHPELEALDSHLGSVCMGGYGSLGESGGEFFFPLRDIPEHKGKLPVFGTVTEGLDVIERIANVPTVLVEVEDEYLSPVSQPDRKSVV